MALHLDADAIRCQLTVLHLDVDAIRCQVWLHLDAANTLVQKKGKVSIMFVWWWWWGGGQRIAHGLGIRVRRFWSKKAGNTKVCRIDAKCDNNDEEMAH